MKKMKKVLAFVLSLVLCIGCLPVVSFAEELEDEGTTYARPGKNTVSFDTNGGTGSVASITDVNIGDEITLPDYKGTNGEQVFLGWSTDKDANGKGVEHHSSRIYQPGETYTVASRTTTFYAIWAKTDESATFYLRLDGQIPQEPPTNGEEYDAKSYTKGVTIDNVLKVAKFYANTVGVDDNLNSVPTNAQLVEMINAPAVGTGGELGFKVEEKDGNVVVTKITNESANAGKYNVSVGEVVYAVWYVVKCAEAGPVVDSAKYKQTDWHVDGVLLTKAKVTLTYSSGNAPAGTVSNMPVGTQWNAGSTVVVGTNNTENNVIKEPARNDGYTFTGWKMYTKDESGEYTVDNGLYNTKDEFKITEDTLLVAQWKKGTNVLKFKKTDTVGNVLSGAEFTISSGDEIVKFVTDANGAYTGDFENQTVYTVTETKAPEGYKTIDPFNFMVTTNDAGELGAYAVDAGGNIIDTPKGVTISYTNGTVSLTVVDEGEFYVYYSHDQSVKTFPLTKTFDITKEVTEGYLYGGYYSAYKKAGTYAGGPKATKDGTSYKGATAGYWDASAAYSEAGTSMAPVAGRTYYLKEVPEAYFQPYMQLVYNGNSGEVVQLYLISATDDKNYQDFGLEAVNTYTQVKAFTMSFKLQQRLDESVSVTVTSRSAFGVNGYLGVWDADNELISDNSFTYRPYVVTPDGVTVYGIKTRTVYTGNVTYTGTLDGGDGLYKVDQQ